MQIHSLHALYSGQVFLLCVCFSVEKHHLALARTLGCRKVSSFIVDGITISAMHNGGNSKKPEKVGTPQEAKQNL